MNPPDHQQEARAKGIYLKAIDKENAIERDAFVEGACADDPSLFEKVNALVKAHVEDSFLEAPAFDPDQTLKDTVVEGPGTRIGRYKLLQQIGEGGMGVVYMAEQTEPVTRKVALKIIKLGMDTKQVVARFEVERQALAMMDHPNIAKVLDAGATGEPDRSAGWQPAVSPTGSRQGVAGSETLEDAKASQAASAAIQQTNSLRYESNIRAGRPYFVMELVRGVPITEYCDKNKLSTEERLRLFMPVCQAIQHAHQKGIIHRDIKPSNVMVTLHDGNAVPKVIDFGIAKATNQKLTEKTLFTNYAQMIGTPAYMSPEQAEMSGLDVDTRTDVYSLGVLLYELLTGTTPFPSKELMSMGYGEMQRIIAEQEPPKPSTRLSTMENDTRTVVAKNRSMDVSALGTTFQGDLDWIVMKALEKDRTHRYETVNGLVTDIRRHLDNEPVSAAAPTFGYQARKFYRRNRKYMRVAAGVAALLIVAVLFSSYQAVRATRARTRAESAQQEAQASFEKAQAAQASEKRQHELADQKAEEALAAQKDAEGNAKALKENLYFQNIALAYREMSADRPADALKLLDDCPEDLRRWEWDHVRHRSLATGQPITRLPDPIYWMTVSTNGQDVAFVSNQLLQVAKLTTAGTLKEIQVLGAVPSPLFEGQPWCAFSPDGRFLAAVSTNGMANLWSVEDRTLKYSFPGSTTNSIDVIAFHPTGKEIAVAKKDEEAISIFEVSSLNLRLQIPMKRLCSALVYSPDGQWLAAGTGDREICIWESSSGRVVKKLSYPSPVQGLAFSPDGLWLAGGGGTTLKLWEVSDWSLSKTLEEHAAWINTLAFTPDGTRLISAGEDREIKIWDPVNQREILSLAGHTNSISAIAVTRAGRLISGSLDGTVQVCETSPLPERRELVTLTGHTNRVNALAFDPNRPGRLVSVDQGLRGVVWDTVERSQVDSFPAHFDVTFSRDGREMISPTLGISDKEGMWVEVRDANSLEIILPPTEKEFVIFCADISVDGDWVAGGTFDREIVIWNRKTGIKHNVLSGHLSFLNTLRFGPKGRYLVSVGIHGETLRWDATRLTEPQKGFELLPTTAVREFSHIGFSPDGQRLATGDGFEGIFILNVETGERLRHIPRAHGGTVMAVTFSPDGRRLASCGMDSVVRLWNSETGEPLRKFIGHTAPVYDVAFSPDGRLLASCGQDQTVKLWDAIDSIAVMPFANESGDPGNEYLSDGITESLINGLSHLPDLKVMSRDSAFRYKGKDTDPQTIGRELGVRAIFKGRVIQQGDSLTLSAELIDTQSDTQQWSKQYSSKASDLLPLQSELAREMTMALRLHLSGEEEKRVVESHTVNPEAYQLYLQGRYWYNKTSEEGLRNGIDYFMQAIAKDPAYALAYSGLAACHNDLAEFVHVHPSEGYPSAREAALESLKRDNTIPEAHAVLGWIKATYDWDWSGGEQAFERAIVLNPNDASARFLYGDMLWLQGRTGSNAQLKRALEIDPISVRANMQLGFDSYFAGQYEEAIRQTRKAIELDPLFVPGHVVLCLSHLQQSSYQQGIDAVKKMVTAFPNSTDALSVLGYAYAVAKREKDARKVLVDLSALADENNRYVPPGSVAAIYAALGEKDQAFKWLNKACEDRSILGVGPFGYLKLHPAFDPLRADPRFAELLRRVNL